MLGLQRISFSGYTNEQYLGELNITIKQQPSVGGNKIWGKENEKRTSINCA